MIITGAILQSVVGSMTSSPSGSRSRCTHDDRLRRADEHTDVSKQLTGYLPAIAVSSGRTQCLTHIYHLYMTRFTCVNNFGQYLPVEGR